MVEVMRGRPLIVAVLSIVAVRCSVGCTADKAPPSDGLTPAEFQSTVVEPSMTPANRPRMMRDRCQFTIEPADALDAAFAGFGGSAQLQWPVSIAFTWTPAADEWLGLDPAHRRQTQLSVVLNEDSVTNIVVHSPGPGAPSTCNRRIEFDAEIRVRTLDRVVDAQARGRFGSQAAVTTGQLRVDMPVAVASPVEQASRSIGITLELPHDPGATPKVDLVGHELSEGVGPGGRSFASGAMAVLGSSPSH